MVPLYTSLPSTAMTPVPGDTLKLIRPLESVRPWEWVNAPHEMWTSQLRPFAFVTSIVIMLYTPNFTLTSNFAFDYKS